MELDEKNIDEVVRALRAQVSAEVIDLPAYFLVPNCTRELNRNRYRGKGRPRKSDYDYIPIDWPELLSKPPGR